MGQKQGGLKGRWNKIALVSIGNVIMGVILQATIEYILTDVLHMRSALKVTIFFPMPWGIAKDVLLGLLFRDILTYVLHRYALHSNNLAAADLHRKWQHAVPAPYSLVAHFDHPLPYLLHIFFPTYIPAVSFRFHLLTYCIYLSLISLEETFAYSGYNVMPSGFILGGIARRQERHLMGSESGNYGCYGFSDLIAGTSLGSDVLDDMRDQKAISDDQAGSKGRAKAKTVRKKK
ncbi:MAG: hypothetical protein MMC33_010445 [Icmadophila ericetorum]|nr:hypothetical protein [Icmadophila ericetorum]